MRRATVLLLALGVSACAVSTPQRQTARALPAAPQLASSQPGGAHASLKTAPTSEHASLTAALPAPDTSQLLAVGEQPDAPLVQDDEDAHEHDAAHDEPPEGHVADALHAAQRDAAAGEAGEPIDDEVDDEPPAAGSPAAGAPAAKPATEQASSADKKHPASAGKPAASVLKLSDAELARRAKRNLASLGPISVGKTNAGALVNGVQMPRGDNWILMDPGHTWGTQETVDNLIHCINKVNAAFPKTHKVRIGHISAKHGGHLKPHRSHQSGRDVDVGYYYKGKSRVRWYRRAHAKNLDVKRTWALVRTMITDTDVEFIFINTSIQRLLKRYALSIGEDRKWLDSLFQYKSKHPWPIIRHVRGHDTHLHVRFYNPIAQGVGVRAHDALAKRGIIKPTTHYVRHRARRGDLLSNLAKRYGTTVAEIQRINGLRNTHIRAGRVYLMPKRVKGQVKRPKALRIPPRRLPPHPPKRKPRRRHTRK